MKKTIVKSLLAVVCLLGSTNVSAYDFMVDGIYYDMLSNHTCYVTSGDSKYTGDVVIPETVNYNNATWTVVTIGIAFNECHSLTSVVLPNTITEIPANTFVDCSGLKSVVLGNSVTKIEPGAFHGCSSLTNITLPSAVTEIGDYGFYGCSSLTNITLPNTVTKIGRNAFGGCSSLTNITLPNSITEIGSDTFFGCSSLTSVTIPNSVTFIGDYAFDSCSNLTSVTLGSSVTTMGDYVFNFCNNLTTLYSLNTTPPNVRPDTFSDVFNLYDLYTSLNVYVPEEALAAYQSANVWKDFQNLQGDPTLGIEGVKGDAINGNNVYYDFRGNRLNAPKKGLNIINGKKVVVK